MSTVRQVISEVRTDTRLGSIDEWLPSAYIHSKLIGYAGVFIKRDAEKRAMNVFSDIWTVIECLEMEEIDLIQCCDIDIPNCKTVMRSKKELPKAFETWTGYLLSVSSVDYGTDYLYTTPRGYKYTVNREFVDKSKRYYWIENKRLIIPGSMVERVRVKGMFTNKALAVRMNCASEEDACINFLDQQFVAPEYLLQNIKDAAVLSILKSVKGLPQDEFPNLNSNEKTNQKP